MIARILVAVEDSAPALRAALTAADLAARLGAALRAVCVLQDGVVSERISAVSGRPAAAGRRQALTDVLSHVARLTAGAGVRAELCQLEGDPGAVILAEADRWKADLLVVGRPVRTAIAGPAPGGVAAHLLEFADVPVLVIP
ncbi:MAG: universal stress protein [Kineosporiaceae bacterium]